MKKRLFVGIKVGKNLQTSASKWQKIYQGKLDVRWTQNKNLHITLIPPWYEKEVNEVIEILSDLEIGLIPFVIQFDKIEFGPDPKRPRLIWALGKKPKGISYLEKHLSFSLNKKPQRKSNFIHLTLGRFNSRDFRKFSIKKIEDKLRWRETVNSITLFESKLDRSGAEYLKLLKVQIQ